MDLPQGTSLLIELSLDQTNGRVSTVHGLAQWNITESL